MFGFMVGSWCDKKTLHPAFDRHLHDLYPACLGFADAPHRRRLSIWRPLFCWLHPLCCALSQGSKWCCRSKSAFACFQIMLFGLYAADRRPHHEHLRGIFYSFVAERDGCSSCFDPSSAHGQLLFVKIWQNAWCVPRSVDNRKGRFVGVQFTQISTKSEKTYKTSKQAV